MEASVKLCHAVCVQNEGLFVSELASFGGSEQGARGWGVRGNGNKVTRRQNREANSESISEEGEGASFGYSTR
jgi:hypothetical protein